MMNSDQNLPQVTIFTDGACLGNPGSGGWAAVLLYNSKRKEIWGGYANTTNNRMELTAAVEALRSLKKRCKVHLITDSRYLHDALNKGWLQKWQRNGWRTADKKPVKNQDLWKMLLDLFHKHQVFLYWTRGHDGTAENERCDYLAKKAAQSSDLSADKGYMI